MTGQRQVGPAHRHAQLHEALAVDGFAGNHRDTQLALEACGADAQAGLRRHIHHVQHEDDGPAQVENLVNEIEISLEVVGVDDAEDAVGLRRVGPAAEQDIAGDRLVGRTRRQRIRTGQIDDRHRLAVLRIGRADFLFDRDAGVIADFLFQSGERIEERALATIGITHEGVDRLTRGRRSTAGPGNMFRQRHDASARGGLHQNLLGFAFAQREPVAAHFDFYRITERCGAHMGDSGAGEQAHFA